MTLEQENADLRRQLKEKDQQLRENHILIARQCESMIEMQRSRLKTYQKAQSGTLEPMDKDYAKIRIEELKTDLMGLEQTKQFHYKLGGTSEF